MESNFALLTVISLSLVISVSSQSYECPNGYTNFLDKCYSYSGDTKDFVSSEAHCNTLHADGHLASIPSQAVQDFIKTTFYDPQPTFFWVGGTDSAVEGTWIWTDGTPFVYTNWGIFGVIQLPEINTQYNCISISDITQIKANWGDAACNGFAHHVCQIPGTLIATTPAPTAAPTDAPTTPVPTTPNPSLSCYGEWIRNGDLCYRITKGLKTWSKAEFFCQTILSGAELAKIDSQGVQDFLFNTYLSPRRHGMWIGLNSQSNVGTWRWSSDSSAPAYTNWGTFNGALQPENVSNKRCVATDNRQGQLGKWNDFKCSMRAWSICQRPAT